MKRNEEYIQGEKLCDLFFFDSRLDNHLYQLRGRRGRPWNVDNSCKGVIRRSDWEVVDLVENKGYFFTLDEYPCFFEKGDSDEA